MMCVAGAFATSALAEGNEKELPKVVVETTEAKGKVNPYADPDTAYKIDRSASSHFTEPLLDTAKSITILSEEVIKDQGARDFKDVMRTQPGITVGTGEGGNAFGDRIFIRGFDARNDVYIDGLRDPGVASREVFATEQIEILKGPSGLFGGRGTTGGAVNIVSKRPQEDNFNEIEVTAGTDQTKRTTIDSNYVINDKFAVRVNGMFHDANVAGRDKVEENRWGGAVALEFKPTEDITFGVDYYHLQTDEIPDWGMPFDPTTNQPFEGGDRDAFYGLVNRDFWDTQSEIATAYVEANLSDNVKLNSKIRYGFNSNEYVAGAPSGPDYSDPDPANWTVSSSPKNRNSDTDYWATQTDLTFDLNTQGFNHTLVTGFEYSFEEIDNNPFSGFDSEAGEFTSINSVTQSILNPNPLQPWGVPIVPGNNFRNTEVENVAIYLQDSVEINDQWKVFAGLRWDNYDINYRETGTGRGGAPVNTDISSDSSFLNYNAGVVYKPAPNGSIYATFATSSNPSGEQVDGSGDSYGGLSTNSQNLDPERNFLYELGTKWELFNGDLALDASIFRIEKEDARVTVGPRGSSVLTDSTEMRVNGIEVGAAGRITDRWSVYSGIALLDTKITDSPDVSLEGEKFPNIAETSFTLLTKYQVTDELEIGGQAYYQGKIYGGSYAAGTAHTPSYWRFDVLSEYELTENVALQLNVLNITNERTYDAIYRSGSPFGYIGAGRAGYLTLSYKF